MQFCNAVETMEVKLCASDTHQGAGAGSNAGEGADLSDRSESWYILLETEVTTAYPGDDQPRLLEHRITKPHLWLS